MEEFDGAIGIDLGTTYSCVGVWKDGRIEIIANDQGNRITPSYVAFVEGGGRIIGDGAKNQSASNPTNTIYDAKRMIGRKFSDPVVQQDKKEWPFTVIRAEGDKPFVEVTVNGSKKSYSPEQISAMVLKKMKSLSESYLGKSVSNAVVTVPAYFNDAQRLATHNAGRIAGLNVLRIINEPTAAAIAYGLGERSHGDRNILIFDLGGGTFDVSLLNIDVGQKSGGIFEVKSTAGDTHLGGQDFDNNMVAFCFEEFRRKTQIDLSRDPRARRRLFTACERAKRILSSSTATTIDIDNFAPGHDFSLPFSRAKFEALNVALFEKCLEPVAKVITDAKIHKSKVHEVVLVGGSTRIPKVQELLREFFSGKVLNTSINPDEAVAHGAAIQAAMLTGMATGKSADFVLVDVVPLSLGVQTKGGLSSIVIPRNATIPTRMCENYTTVNDNQTAVDFRIAEGERPMFSENHLLGEFTLRGIRSAAAGAPSIEVTFDIDVNGILTVTAEDKSSKAENHIVIDHNRDKLSKAQVDRMIEDAERFAAEDELMLKKSLAILDLEKLCKNVQTARQDPAISSQLTDPVKRAVDEAAQSALSWIERERDVLRVSQEEVTKKRLEVEELLSPIISIRPSVRPSASASVRGSGHGRRSRVSGGGAGASSSSSGKKPASSTPKFAFDVD